MLIAGARSNTGSLLWIILAIAFILRINNLAGFSLSNDELSALARLQFDSAFEVIQQGVYVDFHPAGVQLFLYFWTKVFGFSEFAVRFPFALMGVLSVYFLYLIGRRWFGEATGLLAAASLAVLEFPLLYSQIARPYSPGLLVCLMATYFWTKVVFRNMEESAISKFNIKDIAGFVLSVSVCMYNHYFSFIFAGLLCFSGLFFMKRATIFPYLSAGVLILVLYLPHIDIFLHQISKGGVGGADGWLGPPQPDAAKKYINFCFNNSEKLKLLFAIILFGTILLYRGSFKVGKFHVLTFLFFTIPIAIAYYYSIWKNPVFQYSVLLFSFPFLLLFIFSFIPPDKKGFTLTFLLFIVIVGGTYSTVTEKKYYSTAHFTEFRGIAEKIKALDEKLGKDNITRTIGVFHPYYINYYLEKYNHTVDFDIYGIFTREDKLEFFRIIEESKKPYFLYAYSNVYTPPEFDMVIRSQFPWVIVNDSMMGSGLRLYSKERADSSLNRLPVYSLNYLFEAGTWDNEIALRDSNIRYEGTYSVHLKPEVEFSPGLNKKLTELSAAAGSQVEVSAVFYSNSPIENAKLVVSIERDGKAIEWNGTVVKDYFRKPGNWFRVYLVSTVPSQLIGTEDLKCYIWNEKKEDFYIDDFKISIYSPR